MYYYNVQGKLDSLINEHFDVIPPPDYPTIDNILVTDSSCIWKINRTLNENEIKMNQIQYNSCNDIKVVTNSNNSNNPIENN